LRQAGDFIATARPAFQSLGYEVQTARLATIPFPLLLAKGGAHGLLRVAQSLEQAAKEMGYDYISLGPALPEAEASFTAVLEALAGTQDVFLAGMMTTPGGGVSLPAVRACAEIIAGASSLSADGFANLRFAALANVPPGAPFFPAAYHCGEELAFALATEAADLAVQACSAASSLEGARQRLISDVEEHAAKLSRVAGELARQFSLPFSGIDFTLAPFPEQALSFGKAMESLGIPVIGLHGSLAAAAFLADTIDRASYPRAGFNGLMLPVLEDATLAQRAAEGKLAVKDLLLYAAVCGTGLDTIPLPGNTGAGQIYPLLLDLAVLAQRLDKPLTARLMPIPGKQAGDPTGFDFAYFANSRLLPLDAEPLGGLLVGNETVMIESRPVRGSHRLRR
jgi:hypothetical protein